MKLALLITVALTAAAHLFPLSDSVSAQTTAPSTSPEQRTVLQEGDSFFPYLYLSDSFMLIDEGQAKGSVETYTRVIASNGKNVLAAYNNRAVLYLQTGRPDLALADLEKALSLRPDQNEASVLLNNQGYIFLTKGLLDEAISIFNKALESNPKEVYALGNRASVYQKANQHGLALIDLDRAIELDPKQALLFNNRGSL